MAATINMARLQVKLAQDANGKLKALATKRANQIFDDSVEQMQEDFENLSVTQEIAAGIESPNISETLGGGDAPKSLFSFIGFEVGDDPLKPIRESLDPSNPKGPKIAFTSKAQTTPTFNFRVTAPDLQRIYEQTPMPWGKGMSWAQKIETNIPGFAKFLARFMPDADDRLSRSKGGTQLKHDLRSETYTPPKDGFLKKLFADFLASVRSSSRTGGRRRGDGGRFQSFE